MPFLSLKPLNAAVNARFECFDEKGEYRYIDCMQSVRPLSFLVAFAFASAFSCSFNYGNVEFDGESVPEMVLESVSADRYENAALSVSISARTLEMYNTDRVWAASDISFVQYASDNSSAVEAEGTAGLLLVNDVDETYSLGEGVSFHVIEDNLFLSANDLHWSKKNRTLSGARSGEVVLSKDDGTLIRGVGFFADTTSRTYEFAENVSGRLVSGNAETSAGIQ